MVSRLMNFSLVPRSEHINVISVWIGSGSAVLFLYFESWSWRMLRGTAPVVGASAIGLSEDSCNNKNTSFRSPGCLMKCSWIQLPTDETVIYLNYDMHKFHKILPPFQWNLAQIHFKVIILRCPTNTQRGSLSGSQNQTLTSSQNQHVI